MKLFTYIIDSILHPASVADIYLIIINYKLPPCLHPAAAAAAGGSAADAARCGLPLGGQK